MASNVRSQDGADAVLFRLEDLFFPHVVSVGEVAARSEIVQALMTPPDEETIKAWSSCFAALALCDGASIGEAKRKAKEVRAQLRRPEPPTIEEIKERSQDILRIEARALLRDWLEALETEAVAAGGTLDAGRLDAAMLPGSPSATAAFAEGCARRLLGAGESREVLAMVRAGLPSTEPVPPDAAAYLRLQGVIIS